MFTTTEGTGIAGNVLAGVAFTIALHPHFCAESKARPATTPQSTFLEIRLFARRSTKMLTTSEGSGIAGNVLAGFAFLLSVLTVLYTVVGKAKPAPTPLQTYLRGRVDASESRKTLERSSARSRSCAGTRRRSTMPEPGGQA
ncbi:MAG: hypothetical protein M1817_004260 [Caeruleum heppii]|nr:MAG: hypothetical protein M1817_004260 [Caeruleum heppii]